MKTRQLPAETDAGTAGELRVGGRTDVGQERSRNEDQFLIATLQRNLFIQDSSLPEQARRWLPAGRQGTILLVADGMGGGAQGDVASSVAVEAIASYLCEVIPWASNASAEQLASVTEASSGSREETSSKIPAPRGRMDTLIGVRDGLASAMAQGNERVRQEAEVRNAAGHMGTTVTMAYLLWPKLYVAHVGDSRCYLLRGEHLQQLTTDHTFAEKLRASNNIQIDESSPWHHVLWNVVGGAGDSSFEPELYRSTLREGDVLLLCSDGLTKHVKDGEIAEALADRSRAPDAICDSLVQLANMRGGSDNITVVIAQCGIGTSPKAQHKDKPPPAEDAESEAPTRVHLRAERPDDPD